MKKSFGARLKELRLNKNLKQYQVAMATGILKSTLSELENDKHSPSAEALIRLSEYFKVPCDQLLFDKAPVDIAEPTRGYGLPLLDMEERDILEKAHEIISSKTVYKNILTDSINSLYKTMKDVDKKGLNGEQKGENTEKKVM